MLIILVFGTHIYYTDWLKNRVTQINTLAMSSET